MQLMCRIWGHNPSMSRLKRDPETFAEFTQCKRCGAALAREKASWKEIAGPADPHVGSYSASQIFPAKAHDRSIGRFA